MAERSGHYGSAVAAAMRAGNYVGATTGADQPTQYADLNDTSRQEQARHAALLRRVDAEKRARRIVVPTADRDVRGALRKLGHPVRLFGESPADVRERLREALARVEIEGEDRELVRAILAEPDPQAPADWKRDPDKAGLDADRRARSTTSRTDVFAPAAPALIAARRALAPATFEKARDRLEKARAARDDDDAVAAREETAAACYAALAKLNLAQSQFADARPVARVRSSPVAALVATGGWSGGVCVWDAARCERVAHAPRAHADRVTGLAWAPSTLAVATGGADGTAALFDADPASPEPGRELQRFRGHRARLGNVAFHPHGAHVATTSFDHTWRLWDVATGAEVLLQDGHARETYAVGFQCDGAVVATGDFAGIVHVWDCRSGKAIHTFLGHSGKVLALDWNPDGFHLASGSDDHTARVWDLRRKAEAYVLPAHSALVSDVRWSPRSGEALATAAFDGRAKLWRARDWSCLADLAAHDGKAMGVDFGPAGDECSLVTSGYDRTFKLWQPASGDLEGYL